MKRVPFENLKPGKQVYYAHKAMPEQIISDSCLVCAPFNLRAIKMPQFLVSTATGCVQIMATLNPENFIYYE